MCFIDITNYRQCAEPRGHNGPCEVDRRRFAPFLRTFHYPSQIPGFIPCGYVLTGQLPPDQCSTQTRLSEAQACPRCNGTFREHNHLVTYQQGLVAAVGPLDPDHPENGHAFHLPFVVYCELCWRDADRGLQARGDHRLPPGQGHYNPGYDARYYAPYRPPNEYPRGWNSGW
ncbi:hypothetical protein Vi05172_g13588 [Venturia inaequalis]|nr:hypothetical protein Vi05172_g13588 [Venturia inaequalis]